MKKAILSLLLTGLISAVSAQDTIRASFESTPVCFGAQTQFINKTYVPASLGTVDYVWKFAGQGTSTSPFGKHTFKLTDSLKSQSFPVTLVVTSRTNPPDIDSITINTDVYGLPRTWFTWEVENDGQTQTVSIDSLAIDDDIYFYQWNLGGILKSNDRRPTFGGSDIKPFVDGKNYNFTLFMRSPDGCENQYISTFMYDALSVGDLSPESNLAFPNPANGRVHLNKVYDRVQLMDLQGRLVVETTSADELAVSGINAGQYILHLTLDGAASQQRLYIH